MSQTVARLKELLFDNEARALVGLEQRLEALALLDAAERDRLVERIDRLSRTIEDDNELAERIAVILSESLRRAEVSDHKSLSANLAPLVVRTIKAELLNSRDEMVEALYPITGELVKAYVASAMRDLTDQMNRRLEQNAFLLRVQSLLTGRSTAELALAGSQDWQLDDLYLVRRKTGALLARWPQGKPAERDHAMSGILAAINEFASEVLGPETSGLKQIELGENRIYVRASPMHILAARVSGAPPAEIQSMIDETFIRIIETLANGSGATGSDIAVQDALESAGAELDGVVETARERARSGPSPLATLAAFILTPIVLLLAYLGWEQWMLNKSAHETRNIIASVSALRGYPVHVESAAFGKKVTLTGLVPDEDAHEQTLATVRRALPTMVFVDKLSVVRQAPQEIKDFTPDIVALRNTVQSVDRLLQDKIYEQTGLRSIQSLLFAANDLDRAAQTSDDATIRTIASATAKAFRTMTERLQKHFTAATGIERSPSGDATDPAGDAAARTLTIQSTLIDLQEAVVGLERFMSPEANAGTAPAARTPTRAAEASLPPTLDRLAAHAQRAETLAAALALNAKITHGFVRETQLTPREVLIAAITNTAIFFSERNDYREPASAMRTINAVADALKKTDVHLRIVGYTDDTGTPQINQKTSLDRAETVLQAIVAKGVPASRLSGVGRSVGKPLGMVNNASLRDRRVEFELAFPGEPTQ